VNLREAQEDVIIGGAPRDNLTAIGVKRSESNGVPHGQSEPPAQTVR